MVGPAVINIPPLSPLHHLLLLTDLLSRTQMQGLYFVLLCAVPSGVCQSHINEDNDVLSLAFSPLSSSPQALTRHKKKEKERAHKHIWWCGRKPTWSICYKHTVSRSFSPLQLQKAEL